eukprot:29322-Pelagococcus_subviridis.AAC.2
MDRRDRPCEIAPCRGRRCGNPRAARPEDADCARVYVAPERGWARTARGNFFQPGLLRQRPPRLNVVRDFAYNSYETMS